MARPKKEAALGIRERAIEVTLELLVKEDIHKLTMAKVAQAIGCKAPALYNHYRNKEALLRAVHDAGFAKMYSEKMAVAAQCPGTAFDRLRAGGRAYISFALENTALYCLMFAPPKLTALADNPFESDIGRKSLQFLTQGIMACQAERSVKDVDAQTLAFVMWSAVHGAAMLMLQNRTPSEVSEYDQLMDDTVDMVMNLIRS